jgi:hypothetical protein
LRRMSLVHAHMAQLRALAIDHQNVVRPLEDLQQEIPEDVGPRAAKSEQYNRPPIAESWRRRRVGETCSEPAQHPMPAAQSQ